MENTNTPPDGRDPKLWEVARKRAGFKSSLITYVLVNAFLWALWFFTHDSDRNYGWGNFPWPIWPTLGWGIGIAFQYFGAYVYPQANSTEREYEKLKEKHPQK